MQYWFTGGKKANPDSGVLGGVYFIFREDLFSIYLLLFKTDMKISAG